ncbi:uncharacterized protein LOC131936781 [Physella acuta]|uniref:uncharacterized protein LOC131936781 n=1 Tax=Physella acuta TaxID=109671 RepID=UPI0027DD64D0|nr:uncharacterized protein LOC131936781 [Physella acuta]
MIIMTDQVLKRRKKVRAPKLTLVEELTKGLQTDPAVIRSNFTVKDEDGKGRGVYLKLPILRKDSFVLEYEGDVISEAEAQSREKIYAYNNEGCFIMSFVFRGRKLAVDATRRYDSITRLLNHSRQPNIKFHAPLLLDLSGNGLPRIAAYALRDIHRGEEIVFDYGVRDRDIPWLTSKQAGYVSDIDTSSDEETNEGCISMRISPHKRSDYVDKVMIYKENEASESKPMTFKETEASTSSNSSSTKSEELSRKHLTFKQKSKAAFSNKSLGNFRVCCGWRFTRLIPGSNSFYAGLENIGPDMKIHKMYEDFSRRKKKTEEEIICLSASDDSTSSKQRETSESPSVSDVVDQPNTVLSNLSSNINTNSDSKVLDWLPSVRESSSGLSQDMDIKIICVQSLIDPEPKNLNVKQPSTEQKQQPEPVLVIEDSSEDETLTALQNLTCHKSTNLTGSSPSSVSNPLPNISEPSNSMPCLQPKAITALNKKVVTDVYVISDDELPHSNLPPRRPAGQSLPTAVIKPYVAPKNLDPAPTELPVSEPVNAVLDSHEDVMDMALTDDEMMHLKRIFDCHIFSEQVSQDAVKETIDANWEFFKKLIERGISITQIRSTVRHFFKAKDH